MPTLTPGFVIDGKYEIEQQLGIGGMGIVFAARHLQLSQKVAIKVLLPGAASRPEIVARLLREARAAASIESDHVVRILDVGTLESGAPYIVMEHLDGIDLGALLDAEGAMTVRAAADAVLQVCEALAEAHALGIVHRDLKPSNLFRVARRDGTTSIKVLDFGISKAALATSAHDSSGARLTDDSSVIGTVLYMSPEQLRSPTNVDARADIWSLGVVLHELLTTQFPFEATSLPEVTLKIALDEAPSVRLSRPEIDPAMAAIVLRCLAKAPRDRYANVAELANALAPFAEVNGQVLADGASHLLGVDAPADSVLAPRASMPARTSRSPTAMTAFDSAVDRHSVLVSSRRSPGLRAVAPVLGLAAAVALGALVVHGWTLRDTHRPPALTTTTGLAAVANASRSTPTTDLASTKTSPSQPASASASTTPSASSAPLLVPVPALHRRASPQASERAHEQATKPAPRSDVAGDAHSASSATAAPATEAPTVTSECFPPYTLDADGGRIPKPDCL